MFSEKLKRALDIALKASEILKEGFGTHFDIRHKEGRHNLVTTYDEKSEKFIFEQIQKHYPQDGVLAEEGGHLHESQNGWEWVVDPLDGTVNFAHGIPVFSVSIGIRKDKEMLFGVIVQPITKEIFVAEKGKGAYLNEKKLHVTETKKLQDAIFATGFPYNVVEDPMNCIQKLTEFVKRGLPIRRIGVASIDLAYVAAGKFDAFFEVSLKPWDLAAGCLMVEEAGGKVSDWFDAPLNIDGKQSILVSNKKIHEETVSILKEGL